MGTDNWDAALVMRANELLVEIRRYHVDAEATRLQLASTAASMKRKVDELPATVRQVVEEALQQDSLTNERPALVQRLDRSTRMIEELANQFNSSGLSFLTQSRRVSIILIFLGVLSFMVATAWATINGAKAIELSNEISDLQKTVSQLQNSGSQSPIKTCIDSSSHPRLCVRIDESVDKPKGSYYFISR